MHELIAGGTAPHGWMSGGVDGVPAAELRDAQWRLRSLEVSVLDLMAAVPAPDGDWWGPARRAYDDAAQLLREALADAAAALGRTGEAMIRCLPPDE